MSGCWATLWWFSLLTLVYHSGCYLIDPIAATSFSHIYNYINASNLDQDYCEKKLKLTTLDEWKLSTEMFTGTYITPDNMYIFLLKFYLDKQFALMLFQGSCYLEKTMWMKINRTDYVIRSISVKVKCEFGLAC